MESLRASTARGVKWTATSAAFLAVSAPIFQVIKARFLTPEEFAYLAVLFIFIGFMRHLEGAGFTKGAIQKDQVDTEEASSLFFFNLAVSALMALAVFYLARPVAGFFELPRLDEYLRLVSISFLLHGPSRFYRTFLEKYFLFREIALVEMVRQALFISITVSLLVMDWGVLGFVYGKLSAAAVSTLLFTFYGLKHRVTGLRWTFQFSKLRFFIRFGAFVSGRGVLNYMAKRMDEVVIGYFLDPEVLGIYYFGKSLLDRLRMLLSRSYNKVLLPLFSNLKHEPQRLTDAYGKLSRYVAMVAFPIFLGIALTAHLFVPLIYGPQWAESVLVIQVFSVALVLKMLSDGLAGNLLYSVNKPDTAFYLDVVTDGIYFTGLLLFASLGVHAVLVMYAAFVIIKAVAMQYAAHRHLSNNLFDYFFLLKGVTAFTAAMTGSILGFQRAFSPLDSELFLLIGSVAIGTAVYAALTWMFEKEDVLELRDLFKSQAGRA